MDTLAKSFASLVKTNNGLFKSEKQAKFLTSKLIDGAYPVTGNLYGNSFALFYVCDSKGIKIVSKYTATTGKTVTTWERKEEGKETVQDVKAMAKLKREINKLKKSIKSREDEKSDYECHGMIDLYNSAMEQDQIRLNKLLAKVR